jgi:hypothetical protein
MILKFRPGAGNPRLLPVSLYGTDLDDGWWIMVGG